MSVLPQKLAKINKSHGLEQQNFHISHTLAHFSPVFKIFSQDNRNVRKQLPTDISEKMLPLFHRSDWEKIKDECLTSQMWVCL